ncbi:MAG: MoxR family ATPase [Kofleriaceae bacterium]|nr:MoxR family ATPase [Myxococcales bacterium]MCB9559948.1 MoxR family ATPase [Kofleriaceae bacterium]MCB9571563.1 MoxR family ATPase [Kofleriaceae bacterium]
MDLTTVRNVVGALREQVHRVVVGQDHAIDLLMTALLCEGHVLFEGVPGVAKTLLVRTFATGLSLQFGRVQFTPDLMPGDVLGTNLFNFQTNSFTLTKGPIFTELLLADEINRTPPKTQAALLQAMQERTVTIDGVTHDLGSGFMVIATQNPIEQEGTYPLPEAQLDRFLFKVVIGYPDRDQERAIVQRHGQRSAMPRLDEFGLQPVADLGLLVAMRRYIETIRISDAIIDYVVDVIRATRERPQLVFGASPRAAAMLTLACRAYAAMQGRDFVIPDDVKALAVPALRHRVVLAPGAEIEGLTGEAVIQQLLEQVPAPR